MKFHRKSKSAVRKLPRVKKLLVTLAAERIARVRKKRKKNRGMLRRRYCLLDRNSYISIFYRNIDNLFACHLCLTMVRPKNYTAVNITIIDLSFYPKIPVKILIPFPVIF